MRYEGAKQNAISFPLGGIGTGSIGLAGDGRLIDWEIFNRPAKGSINRYSHFAIRAIRGERITAAVLNGDMTREYMGQYEKRTFAGFGFGPDGDTMCGFPHFRDVVFDGEFPMATLHFADEAFPAAVRMTAFNPFIPRDAKNSSLPAAFFEFEVENTEKEEIRYEIALSVNNPYKAARHVSDRSGKIKTLFLYNGGVDTESTEYGDMTIATDSEETQVQTYWYRGKWRDSIVSFWNDFSGEVCLRDRQYDTTGDCDTGTLVASVCVPAGEKKKVRFVFSWNVPNNFAYWTKEEHRQTPWKNYYATVFENSKETAQYALENWDMLYSRTEKFKKALYTTTLPEGLLEAAAANLSVLKSPTVLRLSDGSFYGWEGVHEREGSCEGTCQHVWNYAYALCFLFPELERSIREMEFQYSTDENGRMGFRIQLPLGVPMTEFRACLDGQMGAVIKCYREWKISGDTAWLRENWENIKKVLEYAWSEKNPDEWDRNRDGVLEGRQHHTLDMELFGPSSWLEGMYLLALLTASEMAEALGEEEKAAEYRDLYEKGKKWTRENLFNGRYFIQKVDLSDKNMTDKFEASAAYWNEEVGQIKYQIGEGSSIDQVLAQWHADILGLGDIFDGEQLSMALSHMMEHNFKPSMRGFANPWRIFSLNDEAGTVICDYPQDAEKPKIPIPYCEETMTGFEYAFSGLLCARGKVEDGARVARAVRERFDGEKRNPWNEFECGSNYARSMASYALIPILSGFSFDMPKGHIGFSPYKTDNFSAIWSLDSAWGTFTLSGKTAKVEILEGSLSLSSLGLPFLKTVSAFKIDGAETAYTYIDGTIRFAKTDISESLEITL